MHKSLLKFFVLGFLAIALVSCGDDDDDVVLETIITSLQINSPVNAFGIINETAKTIEFDVPFGTDVTNMSGTLTVSEGATVSPDLSAGVNFTNPVTFTVTNGNESSAYTVTAIEGQNPLRIALVGDAATLADLDPEIRTAYEWAIDQYGNAAGYLPFSEIDATAIETAKAVWFHYTTFPRPDIDNGEPIFPASATGKALDEITAWAQNGGNLLLTSLAGSYVAEVGRVAAEFGPTNFDIGGDPFIENPDNWGISYQPGFFQDDDYPAGNTDYYLFDGLTTSEVTFEGVTYPAIFLSDPGAKKNRAHIWDFNRFFGEDLPGGCDGPNAKKTEFESRTNSQVRASFEWDPAACGVELGAIVEFEPENGYGTVIVIGAGAYEWNLEDGEPNQWQGNVEGITANALDQFIQ